MDLEFLKYPIGRFILPTNISKNDIKSYINELDIFPKNLEEAVVGLNDVQLDTCYRPNGWTIRQVIHHCADSHMNSLVRLKWALTENNPTIKPYYEERWAELPDTKLLPILPSIQILKALHYKYVYLLNNLPDVDFKKTFVHPEHGNLFSIEQHIALYAWHGKHHLGQIVNLKNSEGWT